jgi:hypothetical protein
MRGPLLACKDVTTLSAPSAPCPWPAATVTSLALIVKALKLRRLGRSLNKPVLAPRLAFNTPGIVGDMRSTATFCGMARQRAAIT